MNQNPLEERLDREMAYALKQDMSHRQYGYVFSKADLEERRRRVKAWMFEHGDHQPDGRVLELPCTPS